MSGNIRILVIVLCYFYEKNSYRLNFIRYSEANLEEKALSRGLWCNNRPTVHVVAVIPCM